MLELTLAPELARRIKRHAVAVDSTTSPIYRVFDLPLDGARAPRTGIRALDALGRALQVTDFSVRDMGNDDYTTVLVVFRYAMNLDRVGAGYETVPGVAYVRMAQMRLESYSGIGLRRMADGPSGPTWEYVFREGRGDCPSGCPSYPTPVEYNWRSGAVTLHPEGEP